jgi:hypothetical protein
MGEIKYIIDGDDT